MDDKLSQKESCHSRKAEDLKVHKTSNGLLQCESRNSDCLLIMCLGDKRRKVNWNRYYERSEIFKCKVSSVVPYFMTLSRFFYLFDIPMSTMTSVCQGNYTQ